ncbi:hypothetical protein DITRI_Ditri04bG0028100 [Diplodiscus trichospermus]
MKLELDGAGGHDAGFWALMCMFLYCSELGAKYVTALAFSIDNFKRKPEQVERLMSLMLQKIDLLTSLANSFAVRVHIAGNLELLTADLRDATKKLMGATAGYSKSVLILCIAYDSPDEIVHTVQECCEEKCMDHVQKMCSDIDHGGDDENLVIKLVDIEKHMYMAFAPEPDIVIRTAGENRLSNFMLWQSSCRLQPFIYHFIALA